jgi:membrane-bound ClpP family serine protease
MSNVPPTQQPPSWPTAPSAPRNGIGTAALVLGIIGLVLAVIVLGGLVGIVAVILGIVGLGRVRRGEATNRGVAIGGIVTGALAIVISGIIVAAGAAFWSENKDEIENFNDCVEQAESDQARERCADQFEREIERN